MRKTVGARAPRIVWLAGLSVLLGGFTSRTASARCETRYATFLELTQFPCATVLIAVVEPAQSETLSERTGIKTLPVRYLHSATVRVTRVLRGAYPDMERPLTLWGGDDQGPAPGPDTFPVGSTWAVVLYPIEDADPDDPMRYRLGGECVAEVATRLGPDEASGKPLRQQMDRATRESLPRLKSECAAGEDRSCYAVACAQEQGLGVRRDLDSARVFYRRAYTLRVRMLDPLPGTEPAPR